MSESVFFTIVSNNYVAQAQVLFKSVKKHHPYSQFYIFVSDVKDPRSITSIEKNLNYVFCQEMGISRFYDMAFYYTCHEFNTSLKPFAFKYILELGLYENIFFLDPDIYLYQSLDLFEHKLLTNNIVLTPHLTEPTGADSDHFVMRYGVYNLGFLALKDSAESHRFIEWWMAALSKYCFDDKRLSLFTDQKWIDIVPTIFSGVYIERHPGCNLAYWNLHERQTRVDKDNGKLLVNDDIPVIFFHYSSISFDDPLIISYNFFDFTLKDRPELKVFFDDYKKLLIEESFLELSKVPHAFNYFEDGSRISSLLRRVYYTYCMKNDFADKNPFKLGSVAYKLSQQLPVNGSDELLKFYNSHTISSSDWKVRFVNICIVFCFKMLGYKKSIALFKYMANSSDLSGLAKVFVDYKGKL